MNFEKQAGLQALFVDNDPKEVLKKLSSFLGNIFIDPKKSLLFLDEIQKYPELLAKLRWFAEDMPELPVIAAGSLLEFALGDHNFSMPVGRINYMYLEPLSFEEFLLAQDQVSLLDYLHNYKFEDKIPEIIHQKLLALFKEYIIIGGMPAAVQSWILNHSLQEIHEVHNDLFTTYRDDFSKYGTKISPEVLDDVMLAVPKKLSEKFVYSKVNPATQGPAVKKALDLLSKARVCTKIYGTIANGVPIGAELQTKFLKVIFVDVGLCSTALGLALDQIGKIEEINLINSGGIAEQVAGQLLRTLEPFYVEPALYYWQRESGGEAEIDYIIQHGTKVVPIEVKAGSSGGLKSLHVFMGLRKLPRAVRINSGSAKRNSGERQRS